MAPPRTRPDEQEANPGTSAPSNVTRVTRNTRKLRMVVNAVSFCRAATKPRGGRVGGGRMEGEEGEGGGRAGGVNSPRDGVVRSALGVRTAGVQKSPNNVRAAAASPQTQPQRKQPEAFSEIPDKWGGVEKLEEHWIGDAGVKYLVRCQKKVEWATESALLLRHDGRVALSFYREVLAMEN